jgi:uncharacterized membrane protein
MTGSPAIHAFFAVICHQDPSRSWQLFGEPLPVCIRCTSIYFGFLAALCLRLGPDTMWLRLAVTVILCEFVLARFVFDSAFARALAGSLFGICAAPFVRQGIEEMTGDFL